jgi:hypothetical protein
MKLLYTLFKALVNEAWSITLKTLININEIFHLIFS